MLRLRFLRIIAFLEDPSIFPISSSDIGKETKKDEILSEVKNFVKNGWPKRKIHDLDPSLTKTWKYLYKMDVYYGIQELSFLPAFVIEFLNCSTMATQEFLMKSLGRSYPHRR